MSVGPGRRVLDLGCRYGALTRAYAEGNEVVGIDVDREALAEAAKLGIETIWADAAEPLPFDDESFDVVVLGELLEHLPMPERTVAEARRVLRPGGQAGRLGAERLPAEEPRCVFLAGRPPESDPTHLHMFSPCASPGAARRLREPQLRFVAGRLVPLHPRLFANDICLHGPEAAALKLGSRSRQAVQALRPTAAPDDPQRPLERSRAAGGRAGPCRGSTRARSAGEAARAPPRAAMPSECVVGSSSRRRLAEAKPSRLDQLRAGARPAPGTRAGRRSRCSRRSRARRARLATPSSMYQPPPQKSRGLEPALAEPARPAPRTRAAGSPPVGRACSRPPQCVCRPNGPCAAAPRARGRARATRSRPVGVGRAHERGDLEARRGAAPGARRSAVQTASSSGRSTWQETTAYRRHAAYVP